MNSLPVNLIVTPKLDYDELADEDGLEIDLKKTTVLAVILSFLCHNHRRSSGISSFYWAF